MSICFTLVMLFVQAHGRSLLPLRCTEMEGGFLGKTLLTFVYNRGGSMADPPALPLHKLSPHDVVAIRPAASAATGDAALLADTIAQGIIFRVFDTKVVVAVEDVEGGSSLDVPLRLDKLANKVLPICIFLYICPLCIRLAGSFLHPLAACLACKCIAVRLGSFGHVHGPHCAVVGSRHLW
jgi:hypothetical protein